MLHNLKSILRPSTAYQVNKKLKKFKRMNSLLYHHAVGGRDERGSFVLLESVV